MIQFPDEELIDWWINYLPTTSSDIKQYLPKTDKEWKSRVMKVISLIQMNHANGYELNDVHHIASLVFYKINKAHNEIDGNKRSAIIITYLFFLINNYALVTAKEIRLWAKKIARSRGKKNQEKWLAKIHFFLKENTISLSNPTRR